MSRQRGGDEQGRGPARAAPKRSRRARSRGPASSGRAKGLLCSHGCRAAAGADSARPFLPRPAPRHRRPGRCQLSQRPAETRCMLSRCGRRLLHVLGLRFPLLTCRPLFLCPHRLMKPLVVFVLGGPGAGKGTQCARIVEVRPGQLARSLGLPERGVGVYRSAGRSAPPLCLPPLPAAADSADYESRRPSRRPRGSGRGS